MTPERLEQIRRGVARDDWINYSAFAELLEEIDALTDENARLRGVRVTCDRGGG